MHTIDIDVAQQITATLNGKGEVGLVYREQQTLFAKSKYRTGSVYELGDRILSDHFTERTKAATLAQLRLGSLAANKAGPAPEVIQLQHPEDADNRPSFA